MRSPSPLTPPPTGLVIDARETGAWGTLLGLKGYQRALLAAHHAGLEPLHLWLPADDPSRWAEAEAWIRDPRLEGARVALTSVESELPPLPRVEGAAVFNASAARALVGAEARGPAFYSPPGTPGAAGALLRSLENPTDGLVDAYLNRPLSRVVTRALVPSGVSPNAVTFAACALGLVGAAFVAARRYDLTLLGALLFQLSAALDCVDGEIARLTYRFSPLGARLDLTLDNVAHVLLFLALAWASAPALGEPLALGLGASAALGGAISFALVYRLSFSTPPGSSLRARSLVRRLANRDVSLLVVFACAANRPELVLWLLATGTHVFWIALLAAGATLAPTPGAPPE